MGSREGQWLYFHENGKPSKSLSYKDNLLDGTQTYYYDDGKPKKIINYKDGKFDGSYTTFYPDSVLKMSKFYKSGVVDGTIYTFMTMVKNLLRNIGTKVYKLGDGSSFIKMAK